MNTPPVSLQISLAPVDYRKALILLPHQLDTFAPYCSELLVVVDCHQSRGRFGGDHYEWLENKNRLFTFLEGLQEKYTTQLRIVTVDYRQRRRIGRMFFGGGRCPKKDFRGGPYFSYYYGLLECHNDHVFHIDADMMFGGSPQQWFKMVIAHMATNTTILAATPLGGPPDPTTPGAGYQSAEQYYHNGQHIGWLCSHFTTRVFLIDRRKLYGQLQRTFAKYLELGSLYSFYWALRKQESLYEVPEEDITRFMLARNMRRLDTGGDGCFWSLHPPMRTERFYRLLPKLVESVENGIMPRAQLGQYDVQEFTLDWLEQD